jgi:hypothetical protein
MCIESFDLEPLGGDELVAVSVVETLADERIEDPSA